MAGNFVFVRHIHNSIVIFPSTLMNFISVSFVLKSIYIMSQPILLTLKNLFRNMHYFQKESTRISKEAHTSDRVFSLSFD